MEVELLGVRGRGPNLDPVLDPGLEDLQLTLQSGSLIPDHGLVLEIPDFFCCFVTQQHLTSCSRWLVVVTFFVTF